MDSVKVIVRFALEFSFSLEGEAALFAGYPGDNLERQNLGFWLQNWRPAKSTARRHNSSLFIPWANCLYVEKPVDDNSSSPG
jgi:hypothetical protein